MISCPKCGAANDKAARFCSLCLQTFEPVPVGAYQTDSAAQAAPAPPDRAYPSEPGPMPATGIAAPATPRADLIAPTQAAALDAHYIFPAPESINKSKQKQILLPSAELLSNAFSIFMENMKFYILLSMALSALGVLIFVTVGGKAVSAVMPLVATGRLTPEALNQLGSTLLTTLVGLGALFGFLFLVGQLAFMVATAEMSKGYELSVAAAIAEAVKKSPSFLWITMLQSILAGGLIFAGFALTAITGGRDSLPAVIGLVLGAPVAIVVGTWFSLAVFVYLDRGTRGLAALAASKELIGARWPNVFWRFFVFGAAMAVLQTIPIIGWLISSFVATPLTAIYPWLLYTNLKYLEEAAT